MEALTTTPSPCCRVSSSSSSSSSSSASRLKFNSFVANRLESCFLRTRKVSGFGLLSSVFSKQSKPVCSVSHESQVDLEEVDVQTEDLYQSKSVRVKFQLEKECLFGQRFLIVGNDPMFGSWDPETAVPLNWSDQHVWFAELDIPIGKSIQYKFVLKDGIGEIFWQPGPNRVFQAWETENTIVVSEDWENAELQVITELERQQRHGTQTDISDPIFVAEEAVVANGVDPSKQLLEDHPFQEMPRAIESFATISVNNGRAATISVVNYEGEPVLVPGLPPLLEVPAEEDDRNQAEERITFDDGVEVFEAKDRSVEPEQEKYNNQLEKELTTNDETMYNEEQKLNSEVQSDSGGPENDSDVLFNDLRWGQKTLHNLFTNFRLF